MLIIKGDKNIVTVTRVYIASPEGANGRNVVAYGMLNALTSKYKTMVFRPAVSNHDDFTPILLAASNAGPGRGSVHRTSTCTRCATDKDTARGDIVARSTTPWTCPCADRRTDRRHRQVPRQ